MSALIQSAPDPRHPGRTAYFIQSDRRSDVQAAIDDLMVGACENVFAVAAGPLPSDAGGYVGAVKLDRVR